MVSTALTMGYNLLRSLVGLSIVINTSSVEVSGVADCYNIGDRVNISIQANIRASLIELTCLQFGENTVVFPGETNERLMTPGIYYTVELISTSPLQTRVYANFSPDLNGSIITCTEYDSTLAQLETKNGSPLIQCSKYNLLRGRLRTILEKITSS